MTALEVIAARLGAPVLFVGPVSEGFGIRPPQRIVLHHALERWSARAGIRVFDPTPLIREGDLNDLGHYQPRLDPRLGTASEQAARALGDPSARQ